MDRRRRTAGTAMVPRSEVLEGRELMTGSGSARTLHAATIAQVAPTLPPAPAASFDPTVPQIAAARLIQAGKSASGVAITFTQPMNPGPVSNVTNYHLVDASSRSHNIQQAIVPLRSANYNPASATVTLRASKPLSASKPYIITNVDVANPLKTPADEARFLASEHAFTSIGGVNLGGPTGSGMFSYVVSRKLPIGGNMQV